MPNEYELSEEDHLARTMRWVEAGFASELIAVAPSDAMGPDGAYLKGRGKVPARRLGNGLWVPQGDWTRGGHSESDFQTWAKWGASVGVLARNSPACDIDIYRQDVAENIAELALSVLGAGPVRIGHAPKRLIVYRGDIKKRALSFKLPDDDQVHKIEFLGRGQQYVVEGIHAKTDRPYFWTDEIRPVAGELVEIDEQDIEHFLVAAAERLKADFGATITSMPKAGVTTLKPAKKAEMIAHAKSVTANGPVAEFLSVSDRPGLKSDVEWFLGSSVAAANIREGIDVHISQVRIGYDGPFACLTLAEVLSIGIELMADCPHEDVAGRTADLERCVTDGYRYGIAHLKRWGQFEGPDFWQKLMAVEAQYGEGSSQVTVFKAEYERQPVDQFWGYFCERQRRWRCVANDNAETQTGFLRSLTPGFMSTLKARDWIYGRHYVRGFVSATISPGGVGKSSYILAQMLAICTGRPLLGTPVDERVPVFYFNGEDPADEITLRVAALVAYYGLDPQLLEGWFFYGSGRDTPLIIAEQGKNEVTIIQRTLTTLIAECTANDVGLIVFDPFVSMHAVQENDNGAIDKLIKLGLGRLIKETNCSVEIVHHTRKLNGVAATAEDGRGGSALHAGVRSLRMLSRPGADDRRKLGILQDEAWRYFRVDDGKFNMTPGSKAEWFELHSVNLEVTKHRTGEVLLQSVQAVARWHPKEVSDALSEAEIAAVCTLVQEGVQGAAWRENVQSKDRWIGKAISAVREAFAGDDFELDLSNPTMTKIFNRLVADGFLTRRQELDAQRKSRPSVRLGAKGTDLVTASDADSGSDLVHSAKAAMARAVRDVA